MKVLLDTQAFIWWDVEPARLGPQATAVCFDPSNQIVVSVATVWEMQIKVMLGKLTLRKPLRHLFTDQAQQNGMEVLQVNLEHVLRLDSVPPIHKDPFDRLLVAQALVEGWALVTNDSAIVQYSLPVIW
jgi:PIN domain nuclease of toxin-antitoxin system